MRIADKKYHKKLLVAAIVLPLLAVLVLSTPAQAAPVITLTPNSGVTGTDVTITGTVFDSYIGDSIYIFFDDTEISSSPLTVDETGGFTTDFTIPDYIDPGTYWIEARSETSATSMLAKNFFVVEEVEIELDMDAGYVGTEVTISGQGFYASRTITFYYDNIVREKLGTEVASPYGDFSYQFNVPFSTAGEHQITAENDKGNSAETEFEVIPAIALNLASAAPGELLTVSGSGFGGRIEADVYFGIDQVATARTDRYGNFEVEFNIPEATTGTYYVKVLDEDNNTDKARFATTAGARLSETEGSVGTRITVKGSGFKAGATVTIDYDNLRVATDITDNNGVFSAVFDIPASIGGEHVVKVSDGETTRQFAFTVESEPPPAPELQLPTDGSETRAQAYLDWQDATDTSPPVTYNLQVASDLNFSSLVLEKDGLTDSEYTLTGEEKLPAVKKYAPYYWRVKARDAADNEGEWSTSHSFYVSAPTAPVLLLPAKGSKTEAPLYFYWQGVSSLSPPVTYLLQVASDLNFSSLVLEKTGLANAEYTLTEEEELPEVKQEAPYYWRVKARDAADNEGEWSAVQSFYTDTSFTIPGWLIYTLLAIVVIAVGYVAFRVGRRTAFSPPE